MPSVERAKPTSLQSIREDRLNYRIRNDVKRGRSPSPRRKDDDQYRSYREREYKSEDKYLREKGDRVLFEQHEQAKIELRQQREKEKDEKEKRLRAQELEYRKLARDAEQAARDENRLEYLAQAQKSEREAEERRAKVAEMVHLAGKDIPADTTPSLGALAQDEGKADVDMLSEVVEVDTANLQDSHNSEKDVGFADSSSDIQHASLAHQGSDKLEEDEIHGSVMEADIVFSAMQGSSQQTLSAAQFLHMAELEKPSRRQINLDEGYAANSLGGDWTVPTYASSSLSHHQRGKLKKAVADYDDVGYEGPPRPYDGMAGRFSPDPDMLIILGPKHSAGGPVDSDHNNLFGDEEDLEMQEAIRFTYPSQSHGSNAPEKEEDSSKTSEEANDGTSEKNNEANLNAIAEQDSSSASGDGSGSSGPPTPSSNGADDQDGDRKPNNNNNNNGPPSHEAIPSNATERNCFSCQKYRNQKNVPQLPAGFEFLTPEDIGIRDDLANLPVGDRAAQSKILLAIKAFLDRNFHLLEAYTHRPQSVRRFTKIDSDGVSREHVHAGPAWDLTENRVELSRAMNWLSAMLERFRHSILKHDQENIYPKLRRLQSKYNELDEKLLKDHEHNKKIGSVNVDLKKSSAADDQEWEDLLGKLAAIRSSNERRSKLLKHTGLSPALFTDIAFAVYIVVPSEGVEAEGETMDDMRRVLRRVLDIILLNEETWMNGNADTYVSGSHPNQQNIPYHAVVDGLPMCVAHGTCTDKCIHGFSRSVYVLEEQIKKAKQDVQEAEKDDRPCALAKEALRIGKIQRAKLLGFLRTRCQDQDSVNHGHANEDEKEKEERQKEDVNITKETPLAPGSIERPCLKVNKGGCVGQQRLDCLYQHDNEGQVCRSIIKRTKCKFANMCAYLHPPPFPIAPKKSTGADLKPHLNWVLEDTNARRYGVCTFVNSPKGCMKGDKCQHNHSLTGVQCPDDVGGTCHREQYCPLVHKMCPEFVHYAACSCGAHSQFNHPSDWKPEPQPQPPVQQPPVEASNFYDPALFTGQFMMAPQMSLYAPSPLYATSPIAGAKRSWDASANGAKAMTQYAPKRPRTGDAPPKNAPTGPKGGLQHKSRLPIDAPKAPRAPMPEVLQSETRGPPADAPKGTKVLYSIPAAHKPTVAQRDEGSQPPVNAPKGPKNLSMQPPQPQPQLAAQASQHVPNAERIEMRQKGFDKEWTRKNAQQVGGQQEQQGLRIRGAAGSNQQEQAYMNKQQKQLLPHTDHETHGGHKRKRGNDGLGKGKKHYHGARGNTPTQL